MDLHSPDTTRRGISESGTEDADDNSRATGQHYKLAAQYLAGLYEYYGREWGWTAEDTDGRLTPAQRNFYFEQYLETRRELSDELMLSVTRGINIAMGGKRQTMPFISQRYRILTDVDKEQTKTFPYDVPFFTSREVKELVDLSKQYSFSEFVTFKLQRYAGFPPHVLKSLLPLEGLRFFYDELDYELCQRLSPADHTQWETLIFQYCADFSKLKTPLWTWERARAHLQKDNPLLRRASASDYLWSVWIDFEQRGQHLTESKLFQYAECYQLGQNLTPPMWIQHKSRVTGIAPETLWEQVLKEQGYDIQTLRQTHFQLLEALSEPA